MIRGMKTLTHTEIRRRFTAFFAARDHAVLSSASLVPENDPTVLFTTAGMQPLVPYLLGAKHPEGKRLVNIQRCVRTGDIEEVSDNRHLTFFEMMGNWSLGDYFKHESIQWSLQFLTSEDEGLGLDPKRLFVTVFSGDEEVQADTESIGVWQDAFRNHAIEAKVDAPLSEGGRIFTMGRATNWWGPAGLTGPCGPDSEIYYDTGNEDLPLLTSDGTPDFDSGRLLEVWNNVFMQYSKGMDGSLAPLAQHNVDTGMGLERITMVCQEKTVPFDTDLFEPLMKVVGGLAASEESCRIVADHMRAAVMLIADGVVPSNKDRGYVLRRLIRRSVLHCTQKDTTWIGAVVDAVCAIYQETYPEILSVRDSVTNSLIEEVGKFQRTLERGLVEIRKRTILSGKDAFDLYQSYGFPLELTKEYATSQGITVDEAEFEQEFAKHQEKSRTASAGQFMSGLADHSDVVVRYHTATHLLHQALRNVLGSSVQQKGSNITSERLRFDFSYPQKLTPEQLEAVAVEVNAQIQADYPVNSAVMSLEDAYKMGAIGLFGSKYGEQVTVYTIGRPGAVYSREICTGPHVSNTGTIGKFAIVKEEAVSAGVRRIKAILT